MTTRNVPSGSYPTITSAIAASSAGDTIVVAAGTYTEQVMINVANLTLKGAQAGVDARTRGFVAANESIITFAAPGPGTGIVNFSMPGIVFNGFTVQGNILDSTGALFSGDAPLFLPNTTTIDVTGLQVLNNIIQNNGNGVMIASIEPKPLPVNYLVQYNYFYNNSGKPGNGDGQGVFFNNSAQLPMSNVLVTENLFGGLETSASVNFSNVFNSTISNNVMNADNSIAVFGCTGIVISGNVTSNATGITPGYPTNTASAVFIGFGNTNIQVTKNIISAATSKGVSIYANNTNITVTGNCIVNNVGAGVGVGGGGNSTITVNNNNISGNTPGFNVDLDAYTQTADSLDATNNFWGNASGPNYNSSGPGTGDVITDNNIASTQTVVYSPFSATGTACPTPINVSKTSSSVNVSPGKKITFTVSFVVASGSPTFQLTSFLDALPELAGKKKWKISSSSPAGFFYIDNQHPQNLRPVGALPLTVAPGTYTVTVSAKTNYLDAGKIYSNTVSGVIQIGGISQNFSATAQATMAVCIHGSSRIKLEDGKDIPISELQPGAQIVAADGKVVDIIEAVPCWVSPDGKLFGSCVVFEKDSLSTGVPSQTFIVDPSHPICTPESYSQQGNSELKPAKTFINGNNVYKTTWDKITDLVTGKNERYDIIMPENSCKAYIANGVVVQSRQSRETSGYM